MSVVCRTEGCGAARLCSGAARRAARQSGLMDAIDLNDGVWVDDNTTDTVPCCGWDQEDWERQGRSGRRLPSICGTKPFTTEDPLKRKAMMVYHGRLDQLVGIGGFACSCSGVRSMRWAPHKGTLEAWNAESFCQVLGNRTVLFVGDSTMEQTASVIMNAVYWSLRDRGCQSRLLLAHSDTLVGQNFGVRNDGRHWMHWVRLYEPDIVVASAGAHIALEAGPRAFKSVATTVLRDFLASRKNTSTKPFRLIWRTQTSMGCAAKAGTPITNWSTYQWKDGRVYNYAKQEERDSFAKRLFAEHNVGIMDLEPLRYRPDAHVGVGSQSHPNDCVHFCVPGPLNALLPALFLHALRSVPRFLD